MKNINKVLKHRLLHFIADISIRRRITLTPGFKAVTFTFDDVPGNAYTIGGRILSKYSVRGTYYVSLNLLGNETEMGRIINKKELTELVKDGHELGCHTADHFNAWKVSPEKFEKSILENSRILNNLFPQITFSTFSYPYGSVTPGVKTVVQKYFKCCRGIQFGVNRNKIDLNLLKAVPLYSNIIKNRVGSIKKMIDSVIKKEGWLIFYTHDTSEINNPCGCRPELLEEIIKYVLESGLCVYTAEDAIKKININNSI